MGSLQLQQAVACHVTFFGQITHAVKLLFQKLKLYFFTVAGFFQPLVLQHQAGHVFVQRGKLAVDG